MTADVLSEAEVKLLLEKFEVPPEVAAEIAGQMMKGQWKAPPTVTALLQHVDARAAALAAKSTKRASLADDEARGIGIRVATTKEGSAASALEAALSKSLGDDQGGLDTPSRRLARSLLVGEAITKGLSKEQARQVLMHLDTLNLDPLTAPEAAYRALTLGLFTEALELGKPPTGSAASALVELVKARGAAIELERAAREAQAEADQAKDQAREEATRDAKPGRATRHAARKKAKAASQSADAPATTSVGAMGVELSGYGMPPGSVRVRRWVRLPLAVGNGKAE